MKQFTDDQICKALLNKGFQSNGGYSWVDNLGDLVVVSQDFVIESSTGGTIMASVESGTINNVHPTVWFETIKSELAITA